MDIFTGILGTALLIAFGALLLTIIMLILCGFVAFVLPTLSVVIALLIIATPIYLMGFKAGVVVGIGSFLIIAHFRLRIINKFIKTKTVSSEDRFSNISHNETCLFSPEQLKEVAVIGTFVPKN